MTTLGYLKGENNSSLAGGNSAFYHVEQCVNSHGFIIIFLSKNESSTNQVSQFFYAADMIILHADCL